MDELELKVSPKLGAIEFNNEELKEALSLQMTAYESLEITEDTISENKKDLATLRKIRTAVEDERKRVKKEFTKPLDDFEAKVKELTAIIDKPINMINGKLTEFEEARKAEKSKHLHELYEQNIGDYAEFLPYEKVFSPKWENKGTSDKDILFDISEAVTDIRSNLDAIRALGSEIEAECIKAYKLAGNDLTAAIKKNSDYLAAKALAEKKVREEVKEEIREEIKQETKEVPIVATVTEVASEEAVSFVIRGKDNINEVRSMLSMAEIPFEEV